MKKWIIIGTIALFLVGIYVAISMLYPLMYSKENVAIQNDGVHFFMTPGKLKKIKGKPLKCDKYNIAPLMSYHYTEELYGYKAKSYYDFYTSFWGKWLSDVNIVIEDIELEDAKDLYEKVCESLINYHSTRERPANEYYYYNDDYDGEAEFSCSLGVKSNGSPEGISVYVTYKNGEFSLSAYYTF